jgi:uncharacterized protein YdbL (DUF1318 family)
MFYANFKRIYLKGFMMMKKTAIFLITAAIYSGSVFAAENNNAQSSVETNTTEFQKVVDSYKAYLADVDAKTRDEIVAYRKEVAKLNRMKREEYQKLSQNAQGFLAKEQEFKKKLPLKQRKLINITNPGEMTGDKAQ